jgi:DNA adenine methylase
LAGVAFGEFADALEMLNRKGIDFIVSYDGTCGEQSYGRDLPEHLNCRKIMLNAGISSQSTLLGRRNTTFEALYLSEGLASLIDRAPKQISIWEQVV